ncbi:MarR family transcriptional regulator [Haladaptatus cibarius]|uniref:MarR family transcriptional regulator n=1 Tax=Haladaptatus cibarius TaxID=453847 RepID=UPI00067883F4|nr:helix-turn-helix domain-containing protein [Haladaptatus cibarius]
MPIDIDTFEAASENDLKHRGTNAEQVLSFLAAHPDQAFTPAEIAEETGVLRNSISAVLGRLEERNLVRHRGHYWALGDDEALATYTSTRSTARAMTDRFGAEDPTEWNPTDDSESEDT